MTFAAILLSAVLSKAAFADLPQLVANDPLYPVLSQYDREIGALRETEKVAGLTSVAGDVTRDAARLRFDATAASGRVARYAAAHADDFARREASVLAALSSPAASRGDTAAYRDLVARAASATLANYRAAMAARTQRALDARAQQLRETESTLAFNLEKRDAGTMLLLKLKLRELHLDKAGRASLQAQLDAINARQAAAVDRLRSEDASILAAYRAQLAGREAEDDAQMAGRIRVEGTPNPADIAPASPLLAPLRGGYSFSSDAANIANGFRQAGSDLSARFDELARDDRASVTATNARIAALQATRASLYRWILRRALQFELNRALTRAAARAGRSASGDRRSVLDT
jgi:hypothetical protein